MKTFKQLRSMINEAPATSTLMGGSSPTAKDTATVVGRNLLKTANYAANVGKSAVGGVVGALTPDTTREAPDADKPKNYPGEGLGSSPKAKTSASKGTSDYNEVTPFVKKMAPFSSVAKHKVNVARDAELAKQAEAPPKNPMKMDDPDSTYTKTDGGVVKFPAPKPEINKLKMVEPPKSEPEAEKPVTAPLPKQTLSTQTGTPPTTKSSVSPSKPKIGTTKPAATKLLPSKKSLPSKDPNAGGGFVTARAFGSKSAGVTSTQNVNKSPLDTIKLAKQGSAERSAQMKKAGYKEF